MPATQASRQFLTRYIESNTFLGFKVPSAVNPFEYNILLNPKYPHIGRVTVDDPVTFVFDLRLK